MVRYNLDERYANNFPALNNFLLYCYEYFIFN